MAGGLLLAGLAVPALSTPQYGQAARRRPHGHLPDTGPHALPRHTDGGVGAGRGRRQQAPHPNPLAS